VVVVVEVVINGVGLGVVVSRGTHFPHVAGQSLAKNVSLQNAGESLHAKQVPVWRFHFTMQILSLQVEVE
jgi:hypothetical protein